MQLRNNLRAEHQVLNNEVSGGLDLNGIGSYPKGRERKMFWKTDRERVSCCKEWEMELWEDPGKRILEAEGNECSR